MSGRSATPPAGDVWDNEANRHAWVRRQLADLPAGARLLDAGAGRMPYRDACAHLAYVSQDFGRYEGTGDGAGLQTGAWGDVAWDHTCDLASVPEPDASFGAVLCTEVLEHVPDPVAALREFSRLLTNDGVLLLTAPFASLTHYAPFHFHSGFSRYFYEHWLPRLGFDLRELTPNGSYYGVLAQEIRRLRSIDARYGGGAAGAPLWRRALGFLGRHALLRSLRAAARRDRGSSELLCYGWHARAVRRRTGPTP